MNGRPRPGAAVCPEIPNRIQILIGDVLSGAAEPEAALDAALAAALAAFERL